MLRALRTSSHRRRNPIDCDGNHDCRPLYWRREDARGCCADDGGERWRGGGGRAHDDVGGALTYSDVPDHRAALMGGEVDLAWWSGRLGTGRRGRCAPRDRRQRRQRRGRPAVRGVLVADWLWSSAIRAARRRDGRRAAAGRGAHVVEPRRQHGRVRSRRPRSGCAAARTGSSRRCSRSRGCSCG